ncbi:hypothetical protein BWZ22_00435 [Seonamhaeicola sp. S2-3]|uniref:DUF6787 family protein n=1 Tax=Seonamhaeicola sp. S2-3 TaxID=1936081 RepID=UPI00097298B4|nr:DUF6787 family protein [Seonamhaeicola sp. S2-3]APY09803.1 hypothetical protein BWZ22_00435 [Seonamhaeicola sp. S2-3]
MKKLKERWEIYKNYQLIFPFLGIIGLAYSSFRLSLVFLKEQHIALIIALSAILFFLLLKLVLYIFKQLESKWNVSYRWELISIFLVFAITGSSSVYIGKPIIKFIGITKDNLPSFAYWTLYIFIGFIFYQILLVAIGWLFGQYGFFWNFEKKMLARLGLKRFIE